MTDEIIIRASSLTNYPDCPRRTAADILRPLITSMGYTLAERTNGIGAAIGTALHASAASMLKHKAKTGDLPPADVTDDEAIENLNDAADKGIVYDTSTRELNTAQQQVLRMANVYRFEVAPKIDPILVEERLEAEVKPGLILSGQQDVVAREPGAIRDLKSGKIRKKHTSQIGAYSLLARTLGLEIKKGIIDFIERSPLTKYKKPFPQAGVVHDDVPLEYAEHTAINILHHMHRDIEVFKNGSDELRLPPGDSRAFLANSSSMLCGAKYCVAHMTNFCGEAVPKTEEIEL